MSNLRRLAIVAVIAAVTGGTATAQTRCDCTTIVGACSAQIEVVPGAIEITTDRSECARVDYFVDGLPFVTVARDGRAVAERVAQSNAAEVIVQSCQVCRASSASTAAVSLAPAQAPQQTDPGPLAPIVAIEPEYPVNAERQSIEGYVDLQFVVTPSGSVDQIRVTGSSPSGVFDMAAVSAVSRWRYPADADRGVQTIDERIDFDLDQQAFSAPLAAASLRNSTNSVRNACLRERESYNFGDFVDVILFNTCNEPLAVYACGQGTGNYAQRWVCTDSERLSQVLVNPGDTRIGERASVSTPAGPRPFQYSAQFNVTRAPNSEYWWIACTVDDSDCRRGARSWLETVDRQPASVNPQVRSNLQVSRSY